jgi:hypothetical protein
MVDFGDPLKDLREKRGERCQRLETRTLEETLVRGVFIPQRCLSVVLTWARYYRGFKEIMPVSQYYRRRVVSTEGPSGSTDRVSVVPRSFEITTVNSY